jgi:hypothetical protein
MATATPFDVIEAALSEAFESLAVIADELDGAGVTILKAIKGNSRFKNSSTWVLLPSGNYKHLQSGKITKPERLAGYTEVAYSA